MRSLNTPEWRELQIGIAALANGLDEKMTAVGLADARAWEKLADGKHLFYVSGEVIGAESYRPEKRYIDITVGPKDWRRHLPPCFGHILYIGIKRQVGENPKTTIKGTIGSRVLKVETGFERAVPMEFETLWKKRRGENAEIPRPEVASRVFEEARALHDALQSTLRALNVQHRGVGPQVIH